MDRGSSDMKQCSAGVGTPHESIFCDQERGFVFENESASELVVVPSTSTNYHSLVVETGGSIQRFREFVVFHGEYVYPEFVVAYKRVQREPEPQPGPEPEPEPE
jgi:hypothetical protein